MSATEQVVEGHPLLDARLEVPSNVVYRSLVNETVVLNLESGLYHGLNPTAAKMLDALTKTGTVGEAAQLVALEYDRSLSQIEHDLCKFCESLLERGLLVVGNR